MSRGPQTHASLKLGSEVCTYPDRKLLVRATRLRINAAKTRPLAYLSWTLTRELLSGLHELVPRRARLNVLTGAARTEQVPYSPEYGTL